jgi:hypothetical protein
MSDQIRTEATREEKESMFQDIWCKITDISIPERCSCDRINNKINKIINPFKKDGYDLDYPVCCVICCDCHLEKIYEEVRSAMVR